MALKPVVAIVGRPNVGKSTFFNRLLGERNAIVENQPGTTRDRLYADAEWAGRGFTVVDTGGLETNAPEGDGSLAAISARVREQAEQAIQEADLILFMIDATSGLTPQDYEIANILRRTAKPVLLVANKADNEHRRAQAVDAYDLGMGDPALLSAYHGSGSGDLLDKVVELLPPEAEEEAEEERATRVAIVGRPNVGKSRLLNAILGEERSIVSDVPGTTRDPVDTRVEWAGHELVLIDTAGIRRRGKVEVGIEQWSVIRSLRAISRADVVLLLIDSVEGVTAQDEHIAGYVVDEAKGLVLVVNKWDLVEKDGNTMRDYTRSIRERLQWLRWAPLTFISAKFGQRIQTALEAAIKVAAERDRRAPTASVNRMMKAAIAEHQPPSARGRALKFLYATQADVRPPTFVFFVNDAKQVHLEYKRYLENRLRESFGFEGTPIKLFFRSRQET
jgi:GTP-binding protein